MMNLYEIEWPVRIRHQFERSGFKTVEEVRALTDTELKRIPGLGVMALYEIRRRLGSTSGEQFDLAKVSSERLIEELSRRLYKADRRPNVIYDHNSPPVELFYKFNDSAA